MQTHHWVCPLLRRGAGPLFVMLVLMSTAITAHPGRNPVNAGTYVCDAEEEGFFKDLTKHRAGDAQRVKSGEELLSTLATISGERNCIKTWVHTQHAWAEGSKFGKSVNGGFGGGENGPGTGFYGQDPNPQPQDGGRAKGGRNLEDLNKDIKDGKICFCRPCRIYVYGCRVSNTGDFASNLSKITGCTVYAANGNCSTTHDDGGKGTATDPWRADEGWDTYSDGAKTSLGKKYIEPTTNW